MDTTQSGLIQSILKFSERTPLEHLIHHAWLPEILKTKFSDLFKLKDFDELSRWMANLPGLSGPLIDVFDHDIVPNSEGKSFEDILLEVDDWLADYTHSALRDMAQSFLPPGVEPTPWDILLASQLHPEFSIFLNLTGDTIPVTVTYNGVATVHPLTLGFVAGLQAFRSHYSAQHPNQPPQFSLTIGGVEIPDITDRMTPAAPQVGNLNPEVFPPDTAEQITQIYSRPYSITLSDGEKFVGNAEFLNGMSTAGMWADLADPQIFQEVK